jgi:hypothetical protein
MRFLPFIFVALLACPKPSHAADLLIRFPRAIQLSENFTLKSPASVATSFFHGTRDRCTITVPTKPGEKPEIAKDRVLLLKDHANILGYPTYGLVDPETKKTVGVVECGREASILNSLNVTLGVIPAEAGRENVHYEHEEEPVNDGSIAI